MLSLGCWKHCISQTCTAALVAALVAGFVSARLEPQARAEPRKATSTEADQHFKSGGRLSETVLQEILGVLKSIDTRLERLEKVASQPAYKPATAGSSTTPSAPSLRLAPPMPAEDERIPPVSLDQIQVRRGS